MTNMNPPPEARNTGTPSLRGLQGRSATRLNGQAAKDEVSAVRQGGWMPENISGVPAGRSVFHLTSPFIGPSATAVWFSPRSGCEDGRPTDARYRRQRPEGRNAAGRGNLAVAGELLLPSIPAGVAETRPSGTTRCLHRQLRG